MKFTPRPYQIQLINDACRHLIEAKADGSRDVVLAAAPASGKTVMSIASVARLLDEGAFSRVLVLTHGTEFIRSNYEEALNKFAASVGLSSDDWSIYHPGRSMKTMTARIVVALPQSLFKRDDLPTFDLVVVDEAHHFFYADMVQDILSRCGAKAVLALTGTPAPFVLRGVSRLIVRPLSELFSEGFIADPYIQLAVSDFDFRMADYKGPDAGKELRKGVKFTSKQVENTLDRLMGDLARAVADAKGLAMSAQSERRDWDQVLHACNKTMIVCHSQEMARSVTSYFTGRGIPALLSISDEPGSTTEIATFKDEQEVHRLLVVVNRGGLGFDYPSMMTLIDMTGTLNPDRIFQMICRVVRRHPQGTKADRGKMYVKVLAPEVAGIGDLWVHAALMLASREMLLKWNGENLDGFGKIPLPQPFNDEQQQLIHFYRDHGRPVSVDHPLRDSQEHYFETDPTFLRVARKLFKSGTWDEGAEKPRPAPAPPPNGFLMFADHFVPRVLKGSDESRSVRPYANTTISRALKVIGAKHMSTQEEIEAQYQQDVKNNGGVAPDPDTCDDPNVRRRAKWVRAALTEYTLRYLWSSHAI